MVAALTDGGKTVVVKFRFPQGDARFGDTVAMVKTLPGRRWITEEKCWKVPFSVEAYEVLDKAGFTMDENLQDAYAKVAGAVEQGADLGDAGLDSRLYQFQKDGVLFARDRGFRALIADEMGLGKTAQALAAMWLCGKWPAVAVVPASVKLVWAREAATWLPGLRVNVLSGRKNGGLPPADLYVLNYDILGARLEELLALKPQFVVTDECHYLKNSKAQRTHAVKALCKDVPHVVALSGTPIVNRPVEFFNALNIVRPEAFPSFWRYAQDYCGAHRNKYGWDFSGATNIEKLHDLLVRTVMVRRLKADVLKDLPPKVRAVVPLEMEDRRGYDRLERELAAWVKENRNAHAEALGRIEQLKQAAFARKSGAAMSWIEDFLETGQKLVVFCTHTASVDAVMQAFPGISVRVDGRDSQEARQAAVDRFQGDDGIRLFVGNIKAAGVGITLTAASNTCFLELPWTPGDADQAEDRVHRIGQEADSVTAWYLLADASIETDIARLIDDKRRVLAQVMDGKEVEAGSTLGELMAMLAERE
jgi:SWI/SNF-related matrix-associated actin-dependent regulator 1 of chromatin subfamily A